MTPLSVIPPPAALLPLISYVDMVVILALSSLLYEGRRGVRGPLLLARGALRGALHAGALPGAGPSAPAIGSGGVRAWPVLPVRKTEPPPSIPARDERLVAAVPSPRQPMWTRGVVLSLFALSVVALLLYGRRQPV